MSEFVFGMTEDGFYVRSLGGSSVVLFPTEVGVNQWDLRKLHDKAIQKIRSIEVVPEPEPLPEPIETKPVEEKPKDKPKEKKVLIRKKK